MPPNPPSNSRLPRLAVWSGYGTGLSALLTELVLQRFMCLSMLQIMIKGKSLSVASDNLDSPSFARASTSSTLFIFLSL